MAALRFALKCSRTSVYAPLLNQIDALPLTVSYNFKIASKRYTSLTLEFWEEAEIIDLNILKDISMGKRMEKSIKSDRKSCKSSLVFV